MAVEIHDGVMYGADEIVTRMVQAAIPVARERGFGPCSALGVVRGGILVGGVVYYGLRPGLDIEMSSVMTDPRWARPKVMGRLYRYPFRQLGCVRMTTITAAGNVRARRAIEHMGFQIEGLHRRAWDGTEDAISYGMLRDQCRWLEA